jgi:hypothetical protein
VNEPQTPEQWQAAIDSAQLFLAVGSARQYGLIETHIRIDVARCVRLLGRGKLRMLISYFVVRSSGVAETSVASCDWNSPLMVFSRASIFPAC